MATKQSQLQKSTTREANPLLADWNLYFPDVAYDQNYDFIGLIDSFSSYFLHAKETLDLKSKFYDVLSGIGHPSITIPYPQFIQYYTTVAAPTGQDSASDIEDRLRECPDEILNCLGLALSRVGRELFLNDDMMKDIDPELHTLMFKQRKWTVRLSHYDKVTGLRDLKAVLIGKFVCIRGSVVRISGLKPLSTDISFLCNTCYTSFTLSFVDGKYKAPSKCMNKGCKGKSFAAQRNHEDTVTIDWQTIRIQEKLVDDFIIRPGNNNNDAGRVPRTVECEISQDLVDSVCPGDVVTVAGVLKVVKTDEGAQNKASPMYILYLDVNSITKVGSNSEDDESAVTNEKGSVVFSKKDMFFFLEICDEADPFKLIVNSLCPSIFGHELVKAGLCFSLFGGRRRYSNDNIPIRSDPHVLIVGDPGLGKSQLLHATVTAAPRGVYVCGSSGISTSGLTVTLYREAGTGDFALEAGALVLADQGLCCIDEFDKMSDYQALLEAMEQQSVSIAKAGIVCSLPARSSVVAAANPVGGHYNKSRTVSENLKMDSALLSRFDLIFILLDKPDDEMDQFLSDHIMAMHAGKKHDVMRKWESKASSLDDAVDDRPLSERLKIGADEDFEPIPLPLLRKYIAYARKYVHPRLSAEAAEVLQNFYLTLRKKYRCPDSTPITTRQLESLIRLSEARARLELREVVTKEDAEDVVEILKFSLYDTTSDEFGNLDFQRSQLGVGMSKKGEPKRFVARLHAIADECYNNIFTYQRLQEIAREINLRVDNFKELVESLNNQNYLLKKGNNVYQLTTL
ncbi:MCM2/3/5 family-domain-containing protein [Paraphysoderma sedebokerense]|nr:MCM2/3/5 family-domain-containing protein [Paraphysoderma sedebokerense]